jgi:hypothetical protein
VASISRPWNHGAGDGAEPDKAGTRRLRHRARFAGGRRRRCWHAGSAKDAAARSKSSSRCFRRSGTRPRCAVGERRAWGLRSSTYSISPVVAQKVGAACAAAAWTSSTRLSRRWAGGRRHACL